MTGERANSKLTLVEDFVQFLTKQGTMEDYLIGNSILIQQRLEAWCLFYAGHIRRVYTAHDMEINIPFTLQVLIIFT